MAHVINRNCEFSKIRFLLQSNECTPQPENDDFEGILINVPEEIGFSGGGSLAQAGGILRLSGMCVFPYNMRGLNGNFTEAILFVAVNARTHRAYSGKFEPVDNPDPMPDDEPGEATTQAVGEYFNPDLAEILELPAEEAEYIVYATLAEHKSNVLRVRVRRLEGK